MRRWVERSETYLRFDGFYPNDHGAWGATPADESANRLIVPSPRPSLIGRGRMRCRFATFIVKGTCGYRLCPSYDRNFIPNTCK